MQPPLVRPFVQAVFGKLITICVRKLNEKLTGSLQSILDRLLLDMIDDKHWHQPLFVSQFQP
jgi:hypothetical protein